MRIGSIEVSGIPPVQKFHADNLSDVVVIAGGNGVGKTRLVQGILGGLSGSIGNANLVVESTCQSEKDSWGKSTLTLSAAFPSDVSVFRRTIAQEKSRGQVRSGVLNFESDRSIQPIKPLAFTWDIQDPDSEVVPHNLLLGGLKGRFQDTLHAIFKKIQAQKTGIANRAIALQKEGKMQMNLEFKDPLDPFRKAFTQLLGPKMLVSADTRGQTLTCGDGNQEFGINTLSSGEREVVNIAFDVILRNPSDCIIFFDEPELHLHPELSHRLITTLRSIGERNQFFFCTHSPDIISSSLDDTVIFLTPSRGPDVNQAVRIGLEDENRDALTQLGHSVGIVSLGKKIVLIEGENSSMDKKVYDGLIKETFPSLVLLPSAGKGGIVSFDSVVERILKRSIWGIEFFMLVDRDSAIPGLPQNGEAADGRLRTLSKYHLENYFLDEKVLAAVLHDMGDEKFSDSAQVDALLNEIASGYVSYAAALSVAAEMRRNIGHIGIMPKGCDKKSVAELTNLIKNKIRMEKSRVTAGLTPEDIDASVQERYESLKTMLGGNDWKNEIPGKPVLREFCNKTNLDFARVRTLYVRKAPEAERNPFSEIIEIFRHFAEM